MLALNAHLRVWVAAEPADFRCGIDGLARRVRQKLAQDPFSGGVFVFCNRRRTAVTHGEAYNADAYKDWEAAHATVCPGDRQKACDDDLPTVALAAASV